MNMMAAGGAGLAVAVAAMVAAALMMPPLVAGTYAECYDYCFKDCISKDKSMRDYCSYACDKTCAPDAAATARVPAPGSGGLAMACQIDCARASCHGLRPDGKDDDMTDCYEQCYGRCHTGTDLTRPLRAGKGGDARPAAALPDQNSDEKQDGAGSAALRGQPFQEKQDGVSNEAWRPVRP